MSDSLHPKVSTPAAGSEHRVAGTQTVSDHTLERADTLSAAELRDLALREARSRYLNLLTSLRESGKAVPNEQSLIEAYDFAVTYYLSPKPESAQAPAQPTVLDLTPIRERAETIRLALDTLLPESPEVTQ